MLYLFKRTGHGFEEGGLYDVPAHLFLTWARAMNLRRGIDYDEVKMSQRGQPAQGLYQARTKDDEGAVKQHGVRGGSRDRK